MGDELKRGEAESKAASGQEAGRKTRDEKHRFICDRCGFEMYERNCKVVCPNCGNRFDCSDLNIYFDLDGGYYETTRNTEHSE
jgi:predicted RNA-binding Zn-ribbon protein involved in translation (DUF1610 family)